MKKTFRIAGMVTFVTIALLLSTSCDFFGSSSSSGSTVRSANEALRAIPLASEVVGLNNTLGAASIRALGDGDDESHGIDDQDHPDAAQIFDSWVDDFTSGDILIAILKALADEVDLVMGVENRLGTRSTDFLREICEADPLNDVEGGECNYDPTIDLGVVVVTEPSANQVNIRWVFDTAGLNTGDDDGVNGASNDQEILLIDVTLGGWPNNITTANFWLIIDYGDNVDWEYQSMNLVTNTVNKYIDQFDEFNLTPESDDIEYNKHERMIFRGDGQGGLDAFVSIEAFTLESSIDMDGNESPNQYVMSFRTRSNHTALAVTSLRGPEAEERQYVELFPRTNWGVHGTQALPADDDENHLAKDTDIDERWTIHGEWFVKNAVLTGLKENANATAQLESFLTMSQGLYPTWNDFVMPPKPNLTTDFPQL